MGLELQDITFAEGVLKFALKIVGGSFEGKLNDAGTEIEGSWRQGTPLPLVLEKVEKVTVLVRPQEPKPPFPYQAHDVTFENKAAGLTLAGTLTVPTGKGPHPAVILITGSGPQDRDESLMGHKPFAVLADHLTRQGIAVLRYDDRGAGKSTGNFATATTNEFATDASAAVDYLKARPEIAGTRIGLCGHSEGGVVAPIVASQRSDVAFVVLLAGTGVNGEQVLYEQGQAILKAGGAAPDALEAQLATQKRIFAILREETDMAKAAARLKEVLPGSERQIQSMTSPWMRNFLVYDPATALRKLKCPVLALNGELDTQVLPAQNLPAIEAALKEAGNRDVTITRLPGLNHLFQTAKTGGPGEYGQIEETMSPVALNTISAWIREQAALDKK
jgi:fermentation-respiration switch protein FrsA (DUF1100 family)